MQRNLAQFSRASLGCVLTAPQSATALHKTKTLHYTAGGPQIIQHLSEYKEEQPEGVVEQIEEGRLPQKSFTADYTKQVGLPFCLRATVFIYGPVK